MYCIHIYSLVVQEVDVDVDAGIFERLPDQTPPWLRHRSSFKSSILLFITCDSHENDSKTKRVTREVSLLRLKLNRFVHEAGGVRGVFNVDKKALRKLGPSPVSTVGVQYEGMDTDTMKICSCGANMPQLQVISQHHPAAAVVLLV